MAQRLSVVTRGRRPEWRNERLLGKTFLDHQREVVLRIGNDAWTRDEMVSQLKCANINAARLLTRAAEKLQVESVKQMAARISLEDLFAVKQVGITTVYVWLCVLDALADQDPMRWIDRDDEKIVTLTTEKLRAKKAQEETRRTLRAQRRVDAN
jgi:transcriptional regulator of aromatic amino acid metabolism